MQNRKRFRGGRVGCVRRVFLRNLIRDGIRPIQSTCSSCQLLQFAQLRRWCPPIVNTRTTREITCHHQLSSSLIPMRLMRVRAFPLPWPRSVSRCVVSMSVHAVTKWKLCFFFRFFDHSQTVSSPSGLRFFFLPLEIETKPIRRFRVLRAHSGVTESDCK